MTSIVDLELSIRAHDAAHLLGARLRDGNTFIQLASDIALHLDLGLLFSEEHDPETYGQTLAAAVFGDGRIWAEASKYAEGRGAHLRLRLLLEESALPLHALFWERLRDPAGHPIALSGNTTLLRYVPSADLRPVAAPERTALRALIAIASPSDSAAFGLPPFDVAAQLAHARAALAEVPHLTVLAEGGESGSATPARLAEAIAEGCDLLYLVCHGSLAGGQPFLWLEDETGRAARLAGDQLEQWLRAARRRPLLVVLASCHSAGRGDAVEATAALGPRLARAGVPAVIAMHGLVPVEMVERFMPVLLRDLLAEGQIDRAVAKARAALAASDPWWMPVLYTRVEDGRLWQAGPPPRPARTRPLTIAISSDDPADPRLAALRTRLRLRGLSVAKDDRPELDEADGCILHVTPARLEEERVFERDLAALREAARRLAIPVLVARDGVSRRELRPFVRPADLGWAECDLAPATIDEDPLGLAAAQALELLLKAHRADLMADGILQMGLYTEPRADTPATLELVVDWAELYRRGFPTPERWNDLLLPAMADLRRLLGESAMRRIDLSIRARLSAGLALGYAFRSVTGIGLRVRQGASWWATAPHNLALQPLEVVAIPHTGSSDDVSLELNITQPQGAVSARVTHFLGLGGPALGRRIALERPEGMSNQIDEETAQAIASQVRTVLQQVRRPGGTVHLFMAAPLALVVMIGWQLNTLTPVQCYELPPGAATYEPACRF